MASWFRPQPASIPDFRDRARARLPRAFFDYLEGGADTETTLRANEVDLASLQLRQRVLVDVGSGSLATELFGQPLALPLVLAPVGLAGAFAARGEVQAARAAARGGVPFCASTVSICSLEEVAAAGSAPWFQLYVMRDRGFTRELIDRARQAACPVLVLTVDLPVVGSRRRDARNGMQSDGLSARLRMAEQILARPGWLRRVALGGRPLVFGNLSTAVPGARNPAAFRRWIDAQFDPAVTWKDLDWVRAAWPGPLVLKGILDPADARLALQAGADGIVVSNHGGRQLDGAPSSISALPAIAEAVGDRLCVLMDGGVRTGADLLRALALGARACMVGRPWAYGLAADGERGVAKVLQLFRAELRVAMALTGTLSPRQAGPDTLV